MRAAGPAPRGRPRLKALRLVPPTTRNRTAGADHSAVSTNRCSAGACLVALTATAALRLTRLHTFICGVAFGLGLTVSGMSQQSKVISFLNLAGPWDPSLGFVMAGAVTVSALGYQIFWRALGSNPVCATTCSVPTNKKIDAKLIGGAALFGAGWGLAGLCPGPAITNLSSRARSPESFDCPALRNGLCACLGVRAAPCDHTI